MNQRLRVASALLLVSSVGYSACRGDNYIVVHRDAGAGSAVSAWTGEDPGPASGAGGSRSGSSGPDAAVPDAGVPDVPCENDGNCIDLNPCNGVESCRNGFCAAGTPIRCDDGNGCTADKCDPETGLCTFTTLANGAACNPKDRCDGQVCLEGECTPGPAPVCVQQVNNSCMQAGCDPATGACTVTRLPDGTACDDADRCNGHETCLGGVCEAGPVLNCNDNDTCTVDSCDPTVGCINTPLSDGTSCSDGNICNGDEVCRGGVCQSGIARTCDDHSICTVDTCDPQTGACHFAALPDGTPCPDGNLCDGQVCRAGACVAGTPVVCARDNDNNPCTTATCQSSTGICVEAAVVDGTPCPDANLCNGTETCIGGSCIGPGTPLVCPDDNNPCTTDMCAPAAGCLHVAVADGTSCADTNLCDGTETCTSGVCSSTGVPLNCDDNNPCTADACNPITGCTHTPVANNTSCADSNHCNGEEVCNNGACTQAVAVDCDDHNPCTVDGCNPTTGVCAHNNVANGTVCPDSNACNGTETCVAGVCSGAGVPINCDDNNPCTTDTCDPVSGNCSNTVVSDGTSCSDADLCNGIELCVGGQCQAGVPPCTAPAVCNPSTGACQ